MTTKNRYAKRAKISEAKFKQLLRYFIHDLDAKTIASLTRLNRNTVNRYWNHIRKRIAQFCEKQSPAKGEIEADESYFGCKRIKGKSGRGAFRKTPVFGIFKRGGNVYTEIVPDCAKATSQAIIRGRADPGGIIPSDGWRGYNRRVDWGYKKHDRVNRGADQFVSRKSHINGIESFGAFAKSRLIKFRRITDATFYFFI